MNNDIIREMKECRDGGGADVETKAQALIEKGEKCLQANQEEREACQKKFMEVLNPLQRLRVIVHAVEKANDPLKAADIHAAILTDACQL